MIKKIISFVILLTMIFSNALAFDEINGNKIVLLTSLERRTLNDSAQYEDVTRQRAELACGLIGKTLIDYEWKEISQDSITDHCEPIQVQKWGCLTKDDIKHYKIPTKTMLQAINPNDMETHYHRGGATVAIISLGFIPIIIQYKGRLATNIICGEKDGQNFTTN